MHCQTNHKFHRHANNTYVSFHVSMLKIYGSRLFSVLERRQMASLRDVILRGVEIKYCHMLLTGIQIFVFLIPKQKSIFSDTALRNAFCLDFYFSVFYFMLDLVQ